MAFWAIILTPESLWKYQHQITKENTFFQGHFEVTTLSVDVKRIFLHISKDFGLILKLQHKA